MSVVLSHRCPKYLPNPIFYSCSQDWSDEFSHIVCGQKDKCGWRSLIFQVQIFSNGCSMCIFTSKYFHKPSVLNQSLVWLLDLQKSKDVTIRKINLHCSPVMEVILRAVTSFVWNENALNSTPASTLCTLRPCFPTWPRSFFRLLSKTPDPDTEDHLLKKKKLTWHGGTLRGSLWLLALVHKALLTGLTRPIKCSLSTAKLATASLCGSTLYRIRISCDVLSKSIRVKGAVGLPPLRRKSAKLIWPSHIEKNTKLLWVSENLYGCLWQALNSATKPGVLEETQRWPAIYIAGVWVRSLVFILCLLCLSLCL